MDAIRLLQNLSLLTSKALKLDSSESADQSLLKKAQDAVSQENKLAAVDYSVLSGSQFSETGSFTFHWSQNEDGSGTLDISYQGTATASSASVESKVSSNFSLRLSIGADGTVKLPEEIAADQQQIQGQDFTYSSTGVLQLQSDLAKRMGTESTAQVDLSGKLDEDALAMLKRLGLIDQNGKATKLLQFLSEFAGLDRFKAGQQVSGGTEASYGMSEKALRLQSQMLQSLKMLAALASISSLEATTNSASVDSASETVATDTTAATTSVAGATDIGLATGSTGTNQAADSTVAAAAEATADTTAAVDETTTEQTAAADEELQVVVNLGDTGQSVAVGEENAVTEAAITEAAQQPAQAAARGGAPGGAAPAAASSSTSTDSLDTLIQTLEAAQKQKEQQAVAAQNAASQAAIAAVRAKQSGNDNARVQQVEQEASRAMQVASQAQQAAYLAQLAVENAKRQQQQLASQT